MTCAPENLRQTTSPEERPNCPEWTRGVGPRRGMAPNGTIGADFQEMMQWMIRHKDAVPDFQFAVAPYGVDPHRIHEMKDIEYDVLNLFPIKLEASITHMVALRKSKEQHRGASDTRGGASARLLSTHKFLQEERCRRDQTVTQPVANDRHEAERVPGPPNEVIRDRPGVLDDIARPRC